MEADWGVEIGGGLPEVVMPWEGFVDLRQTPSRAYELSESTASPILADCLIMLNQADSPVFSSKCDFWQLSADEIDPLEFNAGLLEELRGTACYIDMIARYTSFFSSFQAHELWVRSAVKEMRQIALSHCRVDLVVRPAFSEDSNGYALTLYVASCGISEEAAQAVFRTALKTALTITMKIAPTTGE